MAASLFDRRTWPADLKFDKSDVKSKLAGIQQVFPDVPRPDPENFALFAGRTLQISPLLRSRLGHIKMADCHHYMVKSFEVLQKEPLCLPFLQVAAPVMSISVSQSSTERANSVLKLIAGDRRHLLANGTMQDEMVVRLLGPPLHEASGIIHSAMLQWAQAKRRRPGQRQRRIPVDDASGDSTSGSDTDTSTSCSPARTVSEVSDSGSLVSADGATSSAASGTNSEDERALRVQPETAIPSAPAQGTAQQDATPASSNVTPQPAFLEWLTNFRPALQPYLPALQRDGWDTLEALKAMTVDDMSKCGLLPGHRAVLKSSLESL